MSPDPLDLWPAEIVVDPLTPVVILQLQGQKLKERTGGRLHADVVTTEEWDEPEDRPFLAHRFEVVAPALSNYRHQLFVCNHDTSLVYPVYVTLGESTRNPQVASDQTEFTNLIRNCLNSKQTIAVLQSLLARIHESRPATSA